MTRRGLGLLLSFATLVGAPASSSAQDEPFAPLDRPGPALSVPADELRQSLTCTGDLAGPGPEPVLLVHGTTLEPRVQFRWNYIPALDAVGRPHCEVALKENGMGDIQDSAERVVFAIRAMHARAGRRIDVVGHSQGGMVPRWALRFWPDTREMVDDLVGIAASNHGTVDANAICALRCAPSIWQQRSDARFIRALNSRAETFEGIDYTALYTKVDEVVVPNSDDSGSTSLRDGGANVANVAIQDLCPGRLSEHLAVGTYDAAAYAIALDALDHDGPARIDRVDGSACGELFMPGVDGATFVTDQAALQAVLGKTLLTARQVSAEPPLRCYVTASCPGGSGVGARPRLRLSRRCATRGRLRVRLDGPDRSQVRDVSFKLGRRLARRDRSAPYAQTIGRAALRRTSARSLRAVAYLRDGDPLRVILARRLPRCG